MRIFASLLAGVLLIFASHPLAAPAKEPRFVSFTAKGKHGIYLRDLKREEVSLWVDGKPVEVGYLGYKDVQTDFIFLIENSPRTAEFNVSLPQWGQVNTVDRIRMSLIGGFFESVVGIGPVLLAEFDRELEISQDFTTYDDQLVYALHKMKPKPSATDRRIIPVGRHLLWGVETLRKRPAKRKILVLFTTSVDRESFQNLGEYKEVLGLYDVELYVVSFAPRITSGMGKTHEERMNRQYFKQLTGQTAGKLYLTGEYVFIDEFMDDLLVRLTNSYTAGFYVTPGDFPQEHKLEIRARDKKVKVTHRESIVF